MKGSVARWVFAGLSIVFALAFARPALAQDARAEAKKSYDEGVDRFAQGDFKGALASFQSAYQASPYPIVLFNIGQTQASLGNPVEAVDALEKVLANPGNLSPARLEQARTARAAQSALIGEITIVVNVEGAAIECDGANIDAPKPPSALRLKAGKHRLGAVLAGHAPQRKEIDVAPAQRTEVAFELSPIEQRLATLVVQSSVPGATVLVGGQVVGTTPIGAPITVVPGNTTVEVRRPGFTTASRVVNLSEGSSAEVVMDLAEDPSAIRALGTTLVIAASEDQVVVTLDGKPQGTYLGPLPVASGPHRVRLERGGFLPVDREVQIGSSGATKIDVRFFPTPETVVDHADQVGAFQIGGGVALAAGGVVAGAAVGFLAWNEGQLSDAQAALDAFDASKELGEKCNDRTPGYNATTCQEDFDKASDAVSSVQVRRAVGWVGIGLGAASIVTGIVLLATAGDAHAYDRPPTADEFALRDLQPMFGPIPGGAAAGITGRF